MNIIWEELLNSRQIFSLKYYYVRESHNNIKATLVTETNIIDPAYFSSAIFEHHQKSNIFHIFSKR